MKKWKSRFEHAQLITYLKKYSEAESEFRKLLELQPHSIDAKIGLATILYYEKKNSEALALLETIPLEKRTPEVILLFGRLHFANKNYHASVIDYREYLKYYPENQEAKIQLAKILSFKKNYEESIRLYEEVLSENPENIEARREYALVLIWMGRHDDGARELKKTLVEKKIPLYLRK